MDDAIEMVFIGNYLEPIINFLDKKNVVTAMVFPTCSNLAMEGASDPQILKKYIFGEPFQQEIFSSGSIINMFKDLSKRISRDPGVFNDVFRFNGEKKRTSCNKSDYLVVMNTSMGYSVYEHNGMLYSDTFPQNKFIKDIKENGNNEYTKYVFPFPNEFNWKYYYDKFINAILSAYDSEHIILIRTNAAQWYTEGKEIKAFDDISLKFRDRIQQIDDYFVEKTRCRTIDEHYCFIPPANRQCAFTYAVMDEMGYRNISDGILSLINSDYSFEDEASQCVNPFVKRIIKSFTADHVKNNSEIIADITKASSTGGSSKNNEFLNAVNKLNNFIADENYRLSDHVFKLLGQNDFELSDEDLEIIDLYTKYMKLDINDIVAVYKLYERSEDKNKFIKAIKNIIDNPDCVPIKNALRIKEKNMKALSCYRYIERGLISENDKSIYIFVNTNNYIKISPDSSVLMEHTSLSAARKISFSDIREKDYICSPAEAVSIGSSLEFFILKNKYGDRDKPIVIQFKSLEEFAVTLFSFDYEELLNNENFVLSYADGHPDLSEYSSKVNISAIVTPVKEGQPEQLSQIRDMRTIKSLYDADRLPSDFSVSKNILNSLNDPANKRQLATLDKIYNVSQGFAVAMKYLSYGTGVHYFIKCMHLGDNTRSFQLISYFKSYHLMKKSFPINKIVLLTTSNYADFAKAYQDIDEIIILPKDELLLLNDFALSGIGNFNLYADTFKLVRGWGTPSICEIYKLPEDYVYSNPEMYRFPKNLADISVKSALQIFKDKNADPHKTVIIFPYAQASADLSSDIFSKVIAYFQKIGFFVFTNVGLNEKELPGTQPLGVSADVVLAMGSLGCIMIGVQSGMMDTLEWLNINFRFLFISPLDNSMNVRMFLNRWKLLMAAPLPHSLERRIEPRQSGVFIAASNASEFNGLSDDIINQSKYFIKGNFQKHKYTNNEFDFPIYDKENLNDYIASAVGLDEIVFLISVCDSADKFWTKFESRKLLGLQTDLSKVWRLSYVAVVDLQEKVCLEKVDNKWAGTSIQYVCNDADPQELGSDGEEIDICGELPKDNYCYLYSCGMDKRKYTESNIVINGDDYCMNSRGLNIVLYSKRYGCVIDSINVDTFGDPGLRVIREKTVKPTEEENIK